MVKRTGTRDLNIQKVRLAHSLRWGPRGRCKGARPLMRLSAIAKILQVAVTTVHALLRKDPADLSAATPKPRGRHPPLTPRHKGWLMSEETLRRTAHLSLAQRAVLFDRQFPERHVSQARYASSTSRTRSGERPSVSKRCPRIPLRRNRCSRWPC